MSNRTIEDWLNEAAIDPDKGGRCTAFALVHMTGGGTIEEPIHVRQLPDKLDAQIVADCAEMFEHKAKNYAQGLPGAQTFCLQAFYDNAPKPGAKQPFVQAGYTEHDGLMTEAPTGKGLLQQMMRHTEGVISRGMDKDRHLFDALLKTLDIKTRENESLRRENIDSFGMLKDLILQMSDRQHEQRMAEISARNTAQIKEQIVKYAPLLLNQITGREVAPQESNDSLLVESLIDALSGEGMEVAGPLLQKLKLPAPVMASFADRFQRGMQTRQRERQIRQQADAENDPSHPTNGLQ